MLAAQLDKRRRKHAEAEQTLETTPAGRFALKVAREMWNVFLDDSIKEAILNQQVEDARWFLRRVGAWSAWQKSAGRSTVELRTAADACKQCLADRKQNGRPNKFHFHDMVATCAIFFRVAYGDERVPSYEPLARYLELPELGYPLPKHRVTEIATKVVTSFATPNGATRYPATYHHLQAAAEPLLRQHQPR